MSVYDPLRAYLSRHGGNLIPMSFAQVEAAAGHKLPRSAYAHRPWWANEGRGHSHAKAWLSAGYQTEQVDMQGKNLVFRRVSAGTPSGMSETGREFAPDEKKLGRHPAIGAMKGTFWIEPGYDLTRPMYTDEEWQEIEEEMAKDWDEIEQGMVGEKK
ncbi:MAG TPA: hypothetical protein VIM02_04870 [Rhizomicrobium sp.]|jgi:hypothetical protein